MKIKKIKIVGAIFCEFSDKQHSVLFIRKCLELFENLGLLIDNSGLLDGN